MIVKNQTEYFNPSKTYKTQANMQKAIAPLIAEMDTWKTEQKHNMGQNEQYAYMSYFVNVTPEGRFFPVFLSEGFGMTIAHYIIAKGFCIKVS